MIYIDFYSAINNLRNFGLMDVILPFIIFFIIFHTLIESFFNQSNLLSKHATALSTAFTLMIIVPHILGLYSYGRDPIETMNTVFPQIGLLLLGILSIYILVAMFGAKGPTWIAKSGWLAIVVVLTVIYLFAGAAGIQFGYNDIYGWIPWLDSDVLSLAIIGLIFYILVKMITGGGVGSNKLTDFPKNTAKFFHDLFGGGNK